MIILTCATSEKSRYGDLQLFKNFSFRSVIEATSKQARACGYGVAVFDLGTLGLGERYMVDDTCLSTKGYYEREPVPGYKSKSLFKPDLVQLVLDRHNDAVAYLDGDAQLVGCIDEIIGDDYDIGITVRPRWETENEWHKKHFDLAKYANAGVIFFNPTEAARLFVKEWRRVTGEVGNDQMALNRLACPDHYPKALSVETINGVRVKYFPCEQYNFYFFGTLHTTGAKIFHFKGDVRHFYPFSLKHRLYCAIKATLTTCFTGRA